MPTIWRLPLWGVPNGCVSTGCFWCCLKSRQPFAEVDSCYNQLRKRASLSSSSLSIVSELKSGSAWYVPGGCSTIGRLFNDACGRYAFAEDKHSGSIPLAFETVLTRLVMQMYGLLSTIETVI